MKKNIVTDESVKRQITDSISENLTHSDLESISWELARNILHEVLGMRKLIAHWVLRLVTADQKRERLDIT